MATQVVGGAAIRELTRAPTEHALILREDPDLAQGLSAVDRQAATALFRAPLVFPLGPTWTLPTLDPQTTFGLLLLDGLVGRRVRIGRRAVATELLGAGDIIRPGEEPYELELIPADVDWRVFAPSRAAVLDERLTALIGRRPQLLINFSGRLLRRARASSYLTVVGHLPRVEDRVLATLWHIASNWGRVTPEGVAIPFRLTHEVLGEIVGAYRPSVTVAMQTLQSRREVHRAEDGRYVLLDEPPDWTAVESKAS